jgi:hypothetical protein
MAPSLIRAATLALRAASSVCPASPVCPQDDQCALMANGVSLQISCGTDFYGGDLQLAHVSWQCLFYSVQISKLGRHRRWQAA